MSERMVHVEGCAFLLSVNLSFRGLILVAQLYLGNQGCPPETSTAISKVPRLALQELLR